MFQIFTVLKNKKDEEEFMNYANKIADVIYKEELRYVMSELENDLQKTIYLDWWYSGHLWNWDDKTKNHVRAKRYEHVNDYDWNKASGYIMDTISKGMG